MQARQERHVAEAIIRAHADQVGPGSSDPNLHDVSSQTLQQIMADLGVEMEHGTILGILNDLADQDYVTLGPKPNSGDDPRPITKVFPTRLKRQYNLWDVEL